MDEKERNAIEKQLRDIKEVCLRLEEEVAKKTENQQSTKHRDEPSEIEGYLSEALDLLNEIADTIKTDR